MPNFFCDIFRLEYQICSGDGGGCAEEAAAPVFSEGAKSSVPWRDLGGGGEVGEVPWPDS